MTKSIKTKINRLRSQVVSLRLGNPEMTALKRIAKRYGRKPSEIGAMFIEEAIRRSEFAFIDFRDSPIGRQAYVQNSSLAVWEVIMVARHYKMNVKKTAEHFQWPEMRVQAAFNYAQAFSDEIQDSLEENDRIDLDELKKILPQITVFSIGSTDEVDVACVRESPETYQPKVNKRSGKRKPAR